MSLFKHIGIGNRIDIIPTIPKENLVLSRSDDELVLNSSIVEIPDIKGQIVSIYIPVYKGNPVNLEKYGHKNYTVVVYTNFSPVRFRAVFDSVKKDGIDMLSIRLIGGGEKLQRRRYFRLPVHFTVAFAVFDENDEGFNYYKGTVMDISASGARISTSADIPKNYIIVPEFEFNDIGISPNSKIIHKLDDKNASSAHRFKYSIEFEEILEQEQDEIIKYIFQEQLSRVRNSSEEGF